MTVTDEMWKAFDRRVGGVPGDCVYQFKEGLEAALAVSPYAEVVEALRQISHLNKTVGGSGGFYAAGYIARTALAKLDGNANAA
jgi:hypothetical protein